MRIWNEISPEKLCREHLLAEHREALCIWSVITNDKKGYSNHPEVLRYKFNLGALWMRHNKIIKEAKNRGYNFKDLPNWLVYLNMQPIVTYLEPEPWDNQIETLKNKKCGCKIC